MKNYLKRKKKSLDTEVDIPSRITNETVAEHREKVLAGGRKFKYPVQYQKHKLVINSIVIGMAAIVLLGFLGWHQLYVAQDASKLLYRITQIIPVPVAQVDGEPVRYSDYLLRYRSSLFYQQKQGAINLNSQDGKRQAAFLQRQELIKAEKNAYVVKLARDHNTTVSFEEVETFIQQGIRAEAVSLNAYEKTVLNSQYDWSLDEYRAIVRAELLKRKVSFVVDTDAKKKAEALREAVAGGADIAAVATASSDDETTKVNGGDSGLVPVGSLDQNGLVEAAKRLEKDQLSGLIEGVDGYYFIKLVAKDNDNVQYRLVKVALTALEGRFAGLKKDGKIKEYIKVEE